MFSTESRNLTAQEKRKQVKKKMANMVERKQGKQKESTKTEWRKKTSTLTDINATVHI